MMAPVIVHYYSFINLRKSKFVVVSTKKTKKRKKRKLKSLSSTIDDGCAVELLMRVWRICMATRSDIFNIDISMASPTN